MFIARWLGDLRNLRSKLRGDLDTAGLESDGSGEHRIGMYGECAVFRHYQLPWDKSVDRLHNDGADIKDYDISIRTTDWPHGHLVLRPRDNPNYRYVLVTIDHGVFVLRGWMWGYHGKIPRYRKKLNNGRPDPWWVPQEDLLPIHTLEMRRVS